MCFQLEPAPSTLRLQVLMVLDLKNLAKPFQAAVPVVGGKFILNRKHYQVNCDDGFHLVEIEGNRARSLGPYFWTDLPKDKVVYGYTYNDDLIFSNFDVAKRKWKLELKRHLRFCNVETFTAVKALVWEDKQVYFVEPWYEDLKTFELKQAFDAETPLAGLKGVTPELRTLHLFHSLERDQVRALLAAQRAKEEHERLMQDVGYRLRVTFERSEAQLLNFSRSGNRLIVDWTFPGSGYRYNSVLDAESFTVIEAGYCMSGHDREHSATSLVQLAKDYEERDVTHITRR